MISANERRNERYRERKSDKEPGWADKKSYQDKEERINDFLVRNPLPKKSKILELGCGAGNITLFMAEKGFEAYGIELASEALQWAEEKKAQAKVEVSFKLGNIVELAIYPDNFFDFIIDGEALHTIIGSRDRKKCLTNIFRVLKPGGYFLGGGNLWKSSFIGVDNFDSKTRCSYIQGVPHYQLSEEKEFLTEIETAGFQIKHSEKSPNVSRGYSLKGTWLWVDALKPKT